MGSSLKRVVLSLLIYLLVVTRHDLCAGEFLENLPTITDDDITTYLQLPSGIQAIVPAFHFNCSGSITAWSVVVEGVHPSQIDFQVWRGNVELGQFQLLGRNSLPTSSREVIASSRRVTLTVDADSQIEVRQGDIVGFYTSLNGVRVNYELSDTVIMYVVEGVEEPQSKFLIPDFDARELMGAPLLSATLDSGEVIEVSSSPTQGRPASTATIELGDTTLASLDTTFSLRIPLPSNGLSINRISSNGLSVTPLPSNAANDNNSSANGFVTVVSAISAAAVFVFVVAGIVAMIAVFISVRRNRNAKLAQSSMLSEGSPTHLTNSKHAWRALCPSFLSSGIQAGLHPGSNNVIPLHENPSYSVSPNAFQVQDSKSDDDDDDDGYDVPADLPLDYETPLPAVDAHQYAVLEPANALYVNADNGAEVLYDEVQ